MEEQYIYVVAEGNCVSNAVATLNLEKAIEHYNGRTGTFFQLEVWKDGVRLKSFNSYIEDAKDIYNYLGIA